MSDHKPEYLRLLICDMAGARRCRVIPKDNFDQSPQSGVGITNAIMSLSIFEDVVAPGSVVNGTGEVRMIADPNSIVKLPWSTTSYTALCNLCNHDGTSWEMCPRGTLQRCIAMMKKEFKLEMDAGFEVEFQLFDQNDKPLNDHLYSSSVALEEAFPILEEIYCALTGMGIPVFQFHKESAPGQYEFSLQYTSVLEMCDKLLLTREAINAIANKHKVKASFIPKWSELAAGNGNHVHISLRQEGTTKNCLPDKTGKFGISKVAQHFMAGILKDISILTNFTVPSPNSFKRLVPGAWSGAYTCWGQDNRENPLRLTSTGENGSPTNFEIKLMDASGNPYTAMAAIMIAGMNGMRRKMPLPDPINVDPDSIPEEERNKKGILRLPSNNGDAAKLLASDEGDIFRQGLGAEFVKQWMAVREREASKMDNLSVDEQAKLLLYRY